MEEQKVELKDAEISFPPEGIKPGDVWMPVFLNGEDGAQELLGNLSPQATAQIVKIVLAPKIKSGEIPREEVPAALWQIIKDVS